MCLIPAITNRHRKLLLPLLVGWVSLMQIPAQSLFAANISSQFLDGSITTRSWTEIRDLGIVKQDFDYSCGSASLASILSRFYGVPVTESDILARTKKKGAASFSDLADIAHQYGFQSAGLAMTFDGLRQLAIPGIVYLQYRGKGHFSVLRGSNDHWVWLGDPSWGHRLLRKEQFLNMWRTRPGDAEGIVLLVLPIDTAHSNVDVAFYHAPNVPILPYRLLTLRRF